MQTTQEFISAIKEDYAPDWSPVKLLSYADRAQRYLFSNNCAQTTFINGSDPDFPIPYLQTVDSTLQYTINEANLKDSAGSAVSLTSGGYTIVPRVARRVFIALSDVSGYNEAQMFIGRDFDWSGLNPYWAKTLYGLRFYMIPVDIRAASGLEAAKVTFLENPGDTTDRYLVEFYYGPVKLSGLTIPFSFDIDRWEDAMRDGVAGYIEMSRNGKSDRLDKFQNYWKRRFLNSLNEHMEEKKPLVVEERPYG